MNAAALVVFHVQINLDMRIGPRKFRDGSFDCYWVFVIIRGVAVVRPERVAMQQEYGGLSTSIT
jgi:hypothetical protein